MEKNAKDHLFMDHFRKKFMRKEKKMKQLIF